MIWISLFAAGVLHLWWIPALSDSGLPQWLFALTACCLLFIRYCHIQTGPPTFARMQTILLLCMALICGVIYSQWTASRQLQRMLPEAWDRSEFLVTGIVTGIVHKERLLVRDGQQATGYRTQFAFIAESIEHLASLDPSLKTSRPLPKNLRLSVYQPVQIASGQRWQFVVRLRSPRHFANPGSFDTVRSMLTQHIDAYGYVRTKWPPKKLQNPAPGSLDSLRARCFERLSPLLAQLHHADILTALLFGEKKNLSAGTKALLRNTGTSHLMAISGLHIGVAAGLGMLLAKIGSYLMPGILLRSPAPVVAAIMAIPTAVFYALHAGFSVSTQRALLMVCSLFAARLLLRNISAFNSWQIALLCVLLYDPLAILAAGFWLSFAAAGLLIYAMSAPVKSASSRKRAGFVEQMKRTVGSKILLALRAQWTILIGMPLFLLSFGLPMPLLAPVANLLVVPIVSLLVVPPGVLALLASYIHIDIAMLLLGVADFFLQLSIDLLSCLADINATQSMVLDSPLPVWHYLPAALAVLLLMTRPQLPGYGLAALIWLMAFISAQQSDTDFAKTLQSGELLLTQLDVGQGSAVLLSTRNSHWLYDTGGKLSQNMDAGQAIILPFLKHYRIDRLDGVIVSHADNDHSGGALSLQKNIAVQQWLLGGKAMALAPALDAEITACRKQVSWIRDELLFDIIYPTLQQQSTADNENDRSCVLQISSLAHKSAPAALLISGDISRRAEQMLLQDESINLSSTMMIAPHHGSISSSSMAFLEDVAPAQALVSAGFNNRYRHPHPEVIERYDAMNIKLYRSDQLGAIQYKWRHGQWQGPYCERYRGRHFWQLWDNSRRCIGALIKP